MANATEGYLISCDAPVAQLIMKLNASVPASQKFIIHVGDDHTHLFVRSCAVNMIRSAVADWEHMINCNNADYWKHMINCDNAELEDAELEDDITYEKATNAAELFKAQITYEKATVAEFKAQIGYDKAANSFSAICI